MHAIACRKTLVNGLNIFYREAGRADAPTVLLLHGFPSSSHMYRDLIPLLAQDFHVVAPDLPGFGQSDVPSHNEFAYTFANLASVMTCFTEQLKLDRFAVYVFDYGSPVGLRMALQHPERVTAIVSQNGNAYEVGLSDDWNPMRQYWQAPTQANRNALRTMLTSEATYWQYSHGVPDATAISPDGYTLDTHYLARPNVEEAQLDLFLDYAGNVALYPVFQEYFRTHRPPLLAVWGRNDPFFLPAGAEAFRRDIPDAKVVFYETGHFALETHAVEIATEMRAFLANTSKA